MEEKFSDIRVRIAPSPTGLFHIGTARTALFNWLFTKKNGGKFVLRVEDTDKERSRPEYEKDILEGLEWLGLKWDEFYRQSERTGIYKEYLEKLLNEEKAYWCFCSRDFLDKQKEKARELGVKPSPHLCECRKLEPEEARDKLEKGESAVIRFKSDIIPSRGSFGPIVSFTDQIRGTIHFHSSLFGDFVIAKDLDTPLFNFANVVDDTLMKITHIIRGEDHIANTPRQVLIQEALGFERPIYAHLPLILNHDKSKLSKRSNETSLNEYRRHGYLPEAMVNFMAFLGWHPEGDREIFSLNEIAEKFEIEKIQKGGAIFNEEKLNWFNSEYIKSLKADDLIKRTAEFAPEKWFKDGKLFRRAVFAEKERMTRLNDFRDLGDFFFELPQYEADLLVWKNTLPKKTKENLEVVLKILEAVSSEDDAEKKVMAIAEERGRGEVLWPTRVALSGKKASPGPFEIIKVIGLEESKKRLEKAIRLL